MIARLRIRHRRAWILAALVIAATLALALGLRPREANDDIGLQQLRTPTSGTATTRGDGA